VICPVHGKGNTDYRLPSRGPEWAGRPIFSASRTQYFAD